MSAVWEGLLSGLGELLVDAGGRVFGEPFKRRDRAHPILAGIGVIQGSLASSYRSSFRRA